MKFPQIIFVARRAPISRNCYVLPHVFDSLSKVRHLPQIRQVGLFNKRGRRRSVGNGELKNYPFSYLHLVLLYGKTHGNYVGSELGRGGQAEEGDVI